MPNPKTRFYPSTGEGFITMDGGLNNKFPKQIIPDNETPDCLNVVFNDGGVETREGTSKVNTAAIGSFTIMGLYTRHAQDETQTMVAWANGTAYDLQSTSFITIGSAQSVFTTTARIGAAEYENNIYFGDGSNIPYKYNGTDFTRHGIYAPTDSVGVATNATAGNLTGDYTWKVTYVNSNSVESDVNSASATWAGVGESALITSIPVAPQSWGVNSRKLYRTETSGSVYKLVATISNNTQTAYTDNIADASLGADAPTDQGVPPTYDIIEYGADRLFMNDPTNLNYIWYTELANPYVVKATNFRRFGDNSGAQVRGIKFYNNGIVITGDDRMQFLYMPSSDDTTWLDITLKVPYGSKSPFGLVPFKDRLIFPATENEKFVGFGSVVGNTIEPDATFLTVLTAGGDLVSTKIEPDMELVQDAQVKKISGLAFKNKVYFCVTYQAGNTDNNRIYVLNYENDVLSDVQKFSWAPWTGLNAQQFTIYNDELYYGSNAGDGFVYKMLDGTYNDDSSAIDSYHWTKEFPGFKGEENNQKDFRYLYVLHTVPGDWKMNARYRKDGDAGTGNVTEIDLNPGSSLYGTAVFGTDQFNAGTDSKETLISLGGLAGKRVQFRFDNQNTANQYFKIFWIKYAYNKKGYRRI
jgi:hypothetical protein